MEGDVSRHLNNTPRSEQDIVRDRLIAARSVIRAVEAAMHHEATRCGVPYAKFHTLKNQHAKALKQRLREAQTSYNQLDQEYKELMLGSRGKPLKRS